MIAHLVQSGFGGFYDGLLHVLVTVEDLLLVIGISLLAAMRGKPEARAVLVALPLAWLAGGVVGVILTTEVNLVWPTMLSFSLVGALVAINAKVPRAAILGFALLLGALHGFANGAELQSDQDLVLLGIGLSIFSLVALTAAFVAGLRADWTRIAVRVAGSWMVAIGLLMIGWTIKG
jgi:urease accessory protein